MSGDGVSGKDVSASLLDAVDVAVEAYLGEAIMSAAQLRQLGPDAVVALGVLNAPVELRVNGLTIAHGELVAVGDRFGVRITALSQS
jgi:flagellar motor switch protein FliN/FliY